MNIRLLLIIWSLLITQSSFAVTVDNLYRAEIILPLINSETEVVNKAYELAIEEVLVKVSGDADAVQKFCHLLKKMRLNGSLNILFMRSKIYLS